MTIRLSKIFDFVHYFLKVGGCLELGTNFHYLLGEGGGPKGNKGFLLELSLLGPSKAVCLWLLVITFSMVYSV